MTIRRGLVQLTPRSAIVRALAAAALAGCSQASQHAPPLQECLADAGCGLILPTPAAGGVSAGGNGQSQSDDGSATCGQFTFQNAACEACVAQDCCSEELSCSNSQDCLNFAQCLQVCSPDDPTCRPDCQSQEPVGASVYGSLEGCMQTSCGTSCSSADGGAGCGQLGLQNAACTDCISRKCCSQSLACANDPDCVTIDRCAEVCQLSDTACRTSCENLGPTGVAAFAAIDECARASCPGQCP